MLLFTLWSSPSMRNLPGASSGDDAQDLLDARHAEQGLAPAVLAQGVHALLHGRAADLGTRGARHGEPLDVFGDRHDLVQRHPAAVARVRAVLATDRAV